MPLVSGSDWAMRLETGEDLTNPYEAEYPATKWDATTVVSECPKCDCSATTASLSVIIASLQKFSDYQEASLGEIITRLKFRIAAEGGRAYAGDRSTAVGTVASVYGTDKIISEFWYGLQQIERMFMTRAPTPSDTQMLQEQILNIDRFAASYALDPNLMATWKSKLNKWISASMAQAGKKTVYFAPNISAFGSGV